MSSCPGSTLEDYLMWDLDLIVEDQNQANESLRIAEALGVKTRRKLITQLEFNPIVALFEPHREVVEYLLQDFDDDTQSWRDYAGASFGFISETLYDQARALLPS